MTGYQKLAASGITIGVIGWCIAGFLDQRTLGVSIFLAGFVIVVISVIANNLTMDFAADSKLKVPGLGLKISSIGFGISCLAALSGFFIDSGSIANYIFYIGFIMAIIGISIMILGTNNKK